MHTNKLTSLLAAGMFLTLTLGSTAAFAKERHGLAVGGQIDNVNNGLSLKYAMGNFHLQGVLGTDVVMSHKVAGVTVDTTYNLQLSLRALYNIARANDTNLFAGGGVTLGLYDTADTSVTLDLLLGVEHFFTDYFSVSGQVNLPIGFANTSIGRPGTTINLRAAGWGGAFHFYF